MGNVCKCYLPLYIIRVGASTTYPCGNNRGGGFLPIIYYSQNCSLGKNINTTYCVCEPPTYYILIPLIILPFLCIFIHSLTVSCSGLAACSFRFSSSPVVIQFIPSGLFSLPLSLQAFRLPDSFRRSLQGFHFVYIFLFLFPSDHSLEALENTTILAWVLLFCSGLKTSRKLRPHALRLFCSIRRPSLITPKRPQQGYVLLFYIVPPSGGGVNRKFENISIDFFRRGSCGFRPLFLYIIGRKLFLSFFKKMC